MSLVCIGHADQREQSFACRVIKEFLRTVATAPTHLVQERQYKSPIGTYSKHAQHMSAIHLQHGPINVEFIEFVFDELRLCPCEHLNESIELGIIHLNNAKLSFRIH